jgi:hypothetical protein
MASQPYPVAPPPRAPMASQPYPVASPPPPLARQPTLGSGVAATSPRSSGGLQIMAVVLALALVGILAAIVVQLRSTAAPTPPGSVPVTAPSP